MSSNSSPKHRRLAAPSTLQDVIMGTLVQIGRKYLFIDVRKKAAFYVAFVILLSLVGEYFPLPDHFYVVQKNNVLNQYGVKIGWFWTLFLLTPYIWLTSRLHYNSNVKAISDLSRLGVATLLWYVCTAAFVDFERRTGICHGLENAVSRRNCTDGGGKWVPGFDISGHCFLLIYSVLIMCEEVVSFKNWPASPKRTPQHIPSVKEYDEFVLASKWVKYLFIAIFSLHLLWDFQLIITTLYYHHISHKFLGALISVICWFGTYRIWYPQLYPNMPIRRHLKSF